MVRLSIFVLLLTAPWAMANAGQPLAIDATDRQRVAIGNIAQIQHVATKERWSNQSDTINLGFSAGSHQLEFQFDVTKQGADSTWLLDLGSGSIRHVHLVHSINQQDVAQFQTGTGYSANTRALDYYQFVFPISMREGQHRLRLELESHNSVSIVPSLNPPLEWFAAAGTNQWLVGGMMGTFLMLAFYNLVIYGSTREKLFLLFAASCLAGAVWRASELGLSAQFLNSYSPELYELVSRLSVGTYTAFLLLFCREFLRVKEYGPRLAKWTLYAALSIMVLTLFPIFRYAPVVGLLAMFVCPMLAFVIVIRARLRQVPGSGIFLLGVMFMSAIGLLTAARMLGWVGLVFEVRAVTDLSLVIVTLLTSIALASRLSEEKLKRELADAATQAKSLFLANMSHELRTPLNAIVGFSDLLHDSDLGDENKGFARRIDTASKSLLGTINDLLDYSKLEAGQLVVESEPVDLNVLVANVHSLFERRAAELKLDLSVQIHADVPRYFLGDALRLAQILSNLVSNALKFTSQGSVLIRIRLATDSPADSRIDSRTYAGSKAALSQAGQWVFFEVRDTGIGLTLEQQEMLFVPFAQADASTTRRFGGTGLGLSICKELVENMGGGMSLRSVPGRGSCFRFRLCLQACAAPVVLEPKNQAPSADLASYLVLVVEDNKTNQVLIKAMLKKSGVQFMLAEHGQEAIEIIQKARVDLVLMDCQMPVMDGYVATRTIRHELGLQNLPIIALTANASPEDRRRCLGVGMNDFLTKPVRYQQLLDVLHKWMPTVEASAPKAAHRAANKAAQLQASPSLLEIE